MDRKSQNKEILAWLQSGKSITPLEALEKFSCFRLGGRIHELRAAGYPIVTTTVAKNGKHFAEYRLEKSNGT
jgi:hypothetical protein